MTTERLAAPDAELPPLRISGPGDLLQAVPYLLGFHPRASMVIVGLRDAMLVVTVRVDLADLAEQRVLADVIDAMRRGGARELLAAIYDDQSCARAAADLPWRGAASSFVESAARAGCEVVDALLVSDGRWWSFRCDDPDCCPPAGRPLTDEPTAFAAAATYAGLVALPDREALVALLAPCDDRDRLVHLIEAHEHTSVQAVLDGGGMRHERAVKRAIFAAARSADVTSATSSPIMISDDEAARFGVALSAHGVRDAVWMAADDGRLNGRTLWQELARRLPSPYDAAPLFLFGWCSWRSGNGALARIAAERAVQSDPGYSAADLLLAALARGLDPRRLPKLRLPRTG